ncbi:AraC family transcriptional regulator [Algoriphagus ratkowskyi]|uniref:AraC family transcriptional regulator n=1 Tax=Algoriphagus ratkowskyi TaxID=57028 RepID=A0A2W7RQT3_9BACT|nr:GyrI-like domain-containing protein [Algoriphagus ratkowskyi]PZX56849.1 AraC family transcriptional regulator [Algoriphagus ratkowskyi]TXD79764.1 GyrI-like domain-containing protein [Algoriphagus ratkowskyi]
MIPTIQLLPATRLVGMRIQMNFITNKTQKLWKRFMPRKLEIENSVGSELYSVENYPDLTFFEQFNPATEFEKWAAVKVEDFENIPEGMEKLIIPTGLYAVFPFKGTDNEAPPMYQYIMESWIPSSAYELDLRPHFALMGEKYKNNDPDSEENFWVPIKPKSA